MSVFVFGHRNPDTDAICSAIAYADYLQKTTRPDAIAACCGSLNKRTEFVLKTAGLPAPRIIMDVRPEVDDLCKREAITAHRTEVFYEVYEKMQSHRLSNIPVLGDDRRVEGMLTLLDLMHVIFEGDSDPLQARQVQSSMEKMCKVLEGTFQHQENIDQLCSVLIMVGAMSAEGFTQRMQRFPAERLLVVCGDRPTIQLPALEHGVRAIVITGGYQLSPGLLQLAKANHVTVILSPFDTASTTMRLKTARSVHAALKNDFLSLPSKMPLAEARLAIDRTRQSLFPVVDPEGHLIGVLSKSDLLNPPRPQLILVDHNELGQAVLGADESDILEVLDHHRIGGTLKTAQPIRFVNDPVGSTCTLVARQFRYSGITPTPGIALCLAAGIISDTLFLRSPTATQVDHDLLEWVRPLCPVDLEAFAKDFFGIGSALRVCAARDVVREDCKEFEEHGIRFSISQIEEIGWDLFWARKEELHQSLKDLARERKLDFSALLVTDIVQQSSLLLLSDEPKNWDEINYPQVDSHLYELEQVVSRKKQLLPLISSILEMESKT